MTKTITILGSCRQESLCKKYNITSIKEDLSYPHYTKEILQVLHYCMFDNLKPEETIIFRTPAINKKIIQNNNFLNDIKNSDVIFIEIASRKYYKYKNLYAHHILYDHPKYNIFKNEIEFGELTDNEIIEDLNKIIELLKDKKIIIVGHLVTKKEGIRYELLKLLKNYCLKNNISFIDPMTELLQKNFSINDIIADSNHYTEKGHNEIFKIYEKYISNCYDNYCITSYIENCKTNKQSPGLGDYIRGCLTLMKFCEKYNYKFYINKDSHEMFSFFENSEFYIDNNDEKIKKNKDILELIPPLNYNIINNRLEQLFFSKQNLNVLTSGFYNYPHNYGPINNYQFNILNKIFIPNKTFKNEIDNVLKELKVEKNKYNMLHIRAGDQLIRNDRIENTLLQDVINIIDKNNLIKETTVLVTDSTQLALELNKKYTLLKYYNTKKIHLGDRYLNNSLLKKEYIKNTLIDFYLIYYSKNINAIPGSGFSTVASLLGKQKYVQYAYNIGIPFMFV